MDSIKTLIIDDELLARRGLSLRLEKYKEIKVIGECENGRMALKKIAELNPDLIFLDIQMPGINGFEVVEKMQGDDMPLVVFVTAFDQYALDAFEVHAVDYLLKPMDENRLDQAIQRVKIQLSQSQTLDQKQRLINLISNITGKKPAQIDMMIENDDLNQAKYPDKIIIKDAGKTSLIPVVDITWIEAAGDYMCVHSKNPKQVSNSQEHDEGLRESIEPSNFSADSSFFDS